MPRNPNLWRLVFCKRGRPPPHLANSNYGSEILSKGYVPSIPYTRVSWEDSELLAAIGAGTVNERIESNPVA